VPGINSESGEKAAYSLKDLTWDKKLVANYVYEDSKTKYCVLSEKGTTDPKKTVNYQMIAKGLAKVNKPVEMPIELEKIFAEEETLVSEKKLGIWTTLELEEVDDE